MKILFFLCLGALCFGGCNSTYEDWIYGDYSYSESYERSFDEVWETLIEVLDRTQYELKEVNKEESKVVTDWDEHFAPIRGHGMRSRLDATVKEEKGNYKVGIRALQDKNDEMERPLEPEEAEWEYVGRLTGIEQKILLQIHYYLKKDFGLSEELQRELQHEEDLREEGRFRNYR